MLTNRRRYRALRGAAYWKGSAGARMMRGHDGDGSEVVGASPRVARERQDGGGVC